MRHEVCKRMPPLHTHSFPPYTHSLPFTEREGQGGEVGGENRSAWQLEASAATLPFRQASERFGHAHCTPLEWATAKNPEERVVSEIILHHYPQSPVSEKVRV